MVALLQQTSAAWTAPYLPASGGIASASCTLTSPSARRARISSPLAPGLLCDWRGLEAGSLNEFVKSFPVNIWTSLAAGCDSSPLLTFLEPPRLLIASQIPDYNGHTLFPNDPHSHGNDVFTHVKDASWLLWHQQKTVNHISYPISGHPVS